jgi:hypothetical protein
MLTRALLVGPAIGLAAVQPPCPTPQMPHGSAFLAAALAAVAPFERFDPDKDPYQEHDFGALTVAGYRLLWKIDYDRTLSAGSPDPADSPLTAHVLTLMLAEEY